MGSARGAAGWCGVRHQGISRRDRADLSRIGDTARLASNAEAIADPSAHQGLGPVHPGFFAGLPELWTRLKPRSTQKPCIVAGHSLGAARASLFTGLMVLDGKPPVRRLCFGEPRPGFPQAASIIANVRSRSYCNANGRAHDLVTDVPFTSGSRITCIRHRLFRSARRQATPTCSATFSSPGTRCGFMHRQRRIFRSSDRARRA